MINKEKNFISAIVYVHNAAGRIESFLNTVIDVLQDNFEHSEIICVNDSSKDNSADIIKEVSKRAVSTNITILNMSYFHGLETAMNAGIDLSIGDFVIEFDKTVLYFDAEEIMKVYRRSLEGYDIVSASADRRQSFTSHIFYRVFARFGNLRSELSTESFRVLSRRVINRISSMNKTVPYRKAVYANCGLKTDNIKYSPIADAITTINDKQEKRYRTDLAVDSLILFTEIGYRFSIYMTSLMIFITVFMAIYALVIYLIGSPVEGWTTTILFLSFGFFGLFGILTVIVKYLQIIVNLVFKRKRYSFESIEKLTK